MTNNLTRKQTDRQMTNVGSYRLHECGGVITEQDERFYAPLPSPSSNPIYREAIKGSSGLLKGNDVQLGEEKSL